MAEDLKGEISAITKAICKRYTAGDAEGVAEYCTEDPTVMGHGKKDKYVGRSALVELCKRDMSEGLVKLDASVDKVIQASDDLAVAYGVNIMVTTDEKTRNGRWLLVLKKVDGQWKVDVDFYYYNDPE